MTIATGLEAVAKFYFAPPPKGSYWIEAPQRPNRSRGNGSYLFAEWPDEWRVAKELGDAEVSGLFLKFAQLTPTKESVLEFANLYGWLGVHQDVLVDNAISSAEPLEKWISEWHAMRVAVDLAAAVAGKNVKLLKTWLTFYDEDDFLQFRHISEHGITRKKITPLNTMSQYVRKNQWTRAGNIVLHEMINDRLEKMTGIGVAFDPRLNQLSVQIKMTTLLAGMWMQLANNAARNRIARCDACKALIILERSNKRMCGEACRSRLYRHKKK